MIPVVYFRSCLWIPFGVHPNTFDGNPCAIEDPFVHITGTSRGERQATNTPKGSGKHVRYWEYCPCTAYSSEFAQTPLGSAACRIEFIESLHLLEKRAGGVDARTHLVQIINKPH